MTSLPDNPLFDAVSSIGRAAEGVHAIGQQYEEMAQPFERDALGDWATSAPSPRVRVLTLPSFPDPRTLLVLDRWSGSEETREALRVELGKHMGAAHVLITAGTIEIPSLDAAELDVPEWAGEVGGDELARMRGTVMALHAELEAERQAAERAAADASADAFEIAARDQRIAELVQGCEMAEQRAVALRAEISRLRREGDQLDADRTVALDALDKVRELAERSDGHADLGAQIRDVLGTGA